MLQCIQNYIHNCYQLRKTHYRNNCFDLNSLEEGELHKQHHCSHPYTYIHSVLHKFQYCNCLIKYNRIPRSRRLRILKSKYRHLMPYKFRWKPRCNCFFLHMKISYKRQNPSTQHYMYTGLVRYMCHVNYNPQDLHNL